jgi:ferritin-like metal-binding protein YciE
MAKIDSLKTLLVEELRDLYDAEQRLTKAIPKLVEAATHEELASALEAHATETEEHVRRLERVFEALDVPVRARTCPGIRGIIEEADEHANQDFSDDGLRDAAIIGSAQRAEHYEIAAYGTAVAYARLLELDVADELQATLDEEKAADQTLTEIAESVVNTDAASTAGNGRARGADEGAPNDASRSNASRSDRMARMNAPTSGEGARSARSGRSGRRS